MARRLLCAQSMAMLADYVVGELLGTGGMGTVFAADHREHGAVAIKLLHEALTADATFKARIPEEAYILRKVRHPNIVRVIEFGTTETGTPFLVMQRAAGIPLGKVIERDGPLELTRVRQIATQILGGLGAIHRAGLVHGDMKSDNVLVDDRDRVTIIDFGLTRSRNTRPYWLDDHVLSGTPDYMAPELIRGEPMTSAADLYAVGVIIYEMLTGSTPFGGGTVTEIFERHLRDEVVPPSVRCPEREIPRHVDRLVLRALEKHPSARHHDTEMFALAIEHAISTSYREPRARSTTGNHLPANRDSKTSPALPNRRLTPEATPLPDSTLVQSKRRDLATSIELADPDLVIVAALALAEALVNDHRLRVAAYELEAAVAWLMQHRPSAPQRWRLFVMVAALYDSLGRVDRARQSAQQALGAAREVASSNGVAQATVLLERFTSRLQMQR